MNFKQIVDYIVENGDLCIRRYNGDLLGEVFQVEYRIDERIQARSSATVEVMQTKYGVEAKLYFRDYHNGITKVVTFYNSKGKQDSKQAQNYIAGLINAGGLIPGMEAA